MKISVRKGCFETNSSSNHSLIITNEEDMENDKAQFLKEEDEFFAPYGGFCKPLKTKEEKCYFMADLFHKENREFKAMEEEYEVFIQILKDNNETEILENIKFSKNQYFNHEVGEPKFCDAQYGQGCLIECNCPFYEKFRKYFNLNLSTKSLDELLKELEEIGIEGMKKKEEKERKPLDKQKLYNKLKEFIYGNGVIVPYESI